MNVYYKQMRVSNDGNVEGRQEMANWLKDLQINPLVQTSYIR